jgi:hypothetical protein
MMAESMGHCVTDARPFLFQAALMALQQQATASQPMAMNAVIPPRFNGSTQNQKDVNVLLDVHAPAGGMSQRPLQVLWHTVNTSAAATYWRYLASNILPSRLRDHLPWQTGSVSAEAGQSSRHHISQEMSQL